MKIFASSLAFAFLSISASHAEPLDVFRDCDTCPEMIELPMGSFVMGAPPDEFRRNLVLRDGVFQKATPEHPYVKEDEGLQHRVTVDIPIAMGKNEVTYGEWMACVNDGGCDGYIPEPEIGRMGPVKFIMKSLTDAKFAQSPSGKAMAGNRFLRISGDYPVLYVSNLDAQTYVAWLNRKLGIDAYRLPSEAEWEYAARAGTTTRFAQGFEPTSDQANFSGWETVRDLLEERPDLLTRGFPVPVNELDAANVWGIRHMSGNAGEMTLSCYTDRLPSWSKTSEWLTENIEESCKRAVRGGGFAFSVNTARVAWRDARNETYQTKYYGFRVVKEMD